jgi:hypothetical protein
MLIAARHDVEVAWDGAGTDILFSKRSSVTQTGDEEAQSAGPLLLRVTDREIILEKGAPPALTLELRDALGLEVILPKSPSPMTRETRTLDRLRLDAPVTPQSSEIRVVLSPDAEKKKQAIHDFPLEDFGEDFEEEMPPPPAPPASVARPKPNRIVLDPKELAEETTWEDGTLCFVTLESLSSVDLSEVEEFVLVVNNKLAEGVAEELTAMKAALVSSGMSSDVEIEPWIPDALCDVMPRTIILKFNLDGDKRRAPDDYDQEKLTVWVPVGQWPDWSGIEITNLTSVVLDLDDVSPADEDEMGELFANLQDALESLSLPKAPNFYWSVEEYECKRRENDRSYGM